ncbi:MAG: class I SAM-dependent methyltransferase [bacterium]|nr:class I SAM-dependent methyltransferase [bacterium]
MITYRSSATVFRDFESKLHEIASSPEIHTVLDIGGGCNPAIDPPDVKKYSLSYSLLDIERTELEKAPSGYDKICADICSSDLQLEHSYDFVFSMMLAEHVSDAMQFHRNVFKTLTPGGVALHLFPTLYTLPFLVNKFTPERLAKRILDAVLHREQHSHTKFPAYYHWCRGPISKQITRLQNIGYRIEEYRGYYGHQVYYLKLPMLRQLHEWKSEWLVKHPLPLFTSYAILLLRKPK